MKVDKFSLWYETPDQEKIQKHREGGRGMATHGSHSTHNLLNLLGLNVFYSTQDMVKDRAEQKRMFSPIH